MNTVPTSLFAWGHIIAGLVIVVSLSLAQETSSSSWHAFTAYRPLFFPLLCAVGLILAGGLELVFKHRVSPVRENKPGVDSYLASISTFAIMLLFAASFEILGFVVSSFMAMTLLSLFSGARNLPKILFFAALVPSLLYVLMVNIMGVSLPAGALF